MENLKKDLNVVLSKYQDSYNAVYDHNASFIAQKNNMENYNKLFQHFVDEIILKSNEYLKIYMKKEISVQSKETILKFKFI